MTNAELIVEAKRLIAEINPGGSGNWSLGEISELLRDMIAALETQEWQPIETAPLTTTARLIWCPEISCTFAVTWHPGDLEWLIWPNGRPLKYYAVTPTHWRPLPAPPETGE